MNVDRLLRTILVNPDRENDPNIVFFQMHVANEIGAFDDEALCLDEAVIKEVYRGHTRSSIAINKSCFLTDAVTFQ